MDGTDVFSYGRCDGCGMNKPLKNGRCFQCQIEMPEFFKDLLDGFGKQDK
jgi:hypothetical protein